MTRRDGLPRPAVRRSLLAASVLLFAVACIPTLIGQYDDTIDRGVTGVHQQAELYFAKLRSAPTTPFNPAFHDSIASTVKVLRSRASVLPKYEQIAAQLTNLATTFGSFRVLDSTSRRPVPEAVVSGSENAVTVSIESILKLETALKR